MIGRVPLFLVFPALVLPALAASPAMAADEDTQVWLYANAVVPLAEQTSATFELSPRFREGDDQLLARATAELRLSGRVSVGAGAAYVDTAGNHEIRPHQQVTLAAGRLAFRTRVEQRFFEGAERMQLRLRQRVQLSLPVGPATRLTGSGEVLYIARTENRTSAARVDSWRGVAAVNHRLSPHLDGTVGYLLIYSPRSGAEDRISHVPQLTLTWRP
jgi:hypothetical protein